VSSLVIGHCEDCRARVVVRPSSAESFGDEVVLCRACEEIAYLDMYESQFGPGPRCPPSDWYDGLDFEFSVHVAVDADSDQSRLDEFLAAVVPWDGDLVALTYSLESLCVWAHRAQHNRDAEEVFGNE
jgi:hypothetical protein